VPSEESVHNTWVSLSHHEVLLRLGVTAGQHAALIAPLLHLVERMPPEPARRVRFLAGFSGRNTSPCSRPSIPIIGSIFDSSAKTDELLTASSVNDLISNSELKAEMNSQSLCGTGQSGDTESLAGSPRPPDLVPGLANGVVSCHSNS